MSFKSVSPWWTGFKRLMADRAGNVAMMFALAAIPFFAAGGLAVDYTHASQVQSRLSDALDATALAVGSQPNLTDAQMRAAAQRYFNANFPAGEAQVGELQITTNTSTVSMHVTAAVPTAIMNIVGVNTVDVAASVEVKRASNNLEVSLVLDVTGSMAGQRISDLISASNDLIDIVVQNNQTPFFSKIAIVPWSMGVNVGSTLAPLVRGNITRPGSKTITGATKANPVVIQTSANHGYADNELVYISGVNGMTQLNNKFYTVKNIAGQPTKFELWNAAGTAKINGSTYSNYSSGGTAQCGTPGACLTYTFTDTGGTVRTNTLSNCVTERIGAQAYTDAAPSAANTKVGYNYPDSGNPCLGTQIVPLTSNKTTLHNTINSFVAQGSTAGQIGFAWGWYMLSPNFGYLFSGEGVPLPYGQTHSMKITVLMTDGALNSPYCNGVIAADALSGSGSNHINCNATNGSVFNQAKAQCDAMKAAGIVVYTVGFYIDSDTTAKNLMSYCATDASHAYLASNGTQLRDAFRNIAIEISNLRISS